MRPNSPSPNCPAPSSARLEGAFARIRVRGEITEAKTYPSGHTYFSLKDEGGKIRAVIWKMQAARAGLKPENGVEVIATGRISAYGDRSEYQLVVERLEYAGAGALLARIELLRAAPGRRRTVRRGPQARDPAAAGADRGDHFGQGRRAARHPDHDRAAVSPSHPALWRAGAGRGRGGEDRRRHRRRWTACRHPALRGRTC